MKPQGVTGPSHEAGAGWAPLVACLALLLLVWGSLLALGLHQRGQDAARALDRAELMARVLADNANRNVEAAALAAATLAELLASGLPPDGPELRTAMAQTLVNLPFLRGLALVDAQGRVLASDDAAARGAVLRLGALEPLPPAGSERLADLVPARRMADLRVAGPAPALPPGVGFLPLLRTVEVPGGRLLTVVTQLNPQSFSAFQELLLGDAASAAALLSYDGRLVAATKNVPVVPGTLLTALPPHAQFLPQLEHGRWAGAGLRAGGQLASFRVAATRPLLVLVETSQQAVVNAARQRERALWGAGVAASGLALGLSLLWRHYRQARGLARRQLDAAQAEVSRSERALSITVKSVQELIFRCDGEGRLTYANERWQAITGQALGSAAGTTLADLAPALQRAELQALFSPALGAGLRRAQASLLAQDGTERQFEIAVMPLQQDGRLVGYAGSAVDVTALLQAQRALQVQLAFLRELMDVSPLPISVVGLDRRYRLVNKSWEAFTGRRREEAIGAVVGGHLSLEEQAVHEAQDRALLASGQALRYAATARHHDGSTRDVQVDKLLLPGLDGRPEGILSVVVDVTEFRNAERATREARDAAESASRAKSDFIANISHELRTPLQAIIGFAELGQLRAVGDTGLGGRLTPMFADIEGAGQRMLALVNDLLDLAKAEHGASAMALAPTDLRPLAQASAQELEPLLLQRQLILDLQLPASPLLAQVDATQLRQVLRNLLANAIKFSPTGGPLEIQLQAWAERGRPEIRLSVSDRGPGVPPAELESIFDAFVQSSQTKDGSGGTGLGLAICRKIICAHGGQIRAYNRPGGGAVFEVLLPAAAHWPSAPGEIEPQAITTA